MRAALFRARSRRRKEVRSKKSNVSRVPAPCRIGGLLMPLHNLKRGVPTYLFGPPRRRRNRSRDLPTYPGTARTTSRPHATTHAIDGARRCCRCAGCRARSGARGWGTHPHWRAYHRYFREGSRFRPRCAAGPLQRAAGVEKFPSKAVFLENYVKS